MHRASCIKSYYILIEWTNQYLILKMKPRKTELMIAKKTTNNHHNSIDECAKLFAHYSLKINFKAVSRENVLRKTVFHYNFIYHFRFE